MKIAVIGSGVAGLTSSYLLTSKADVTLYEKDSRLGGHAHTKILTIDGQTIPVDTGFMVYNPERYPHLIELFETLGVESFDTDMSFSVSVENEIEYSSNIMKNPFLNRKVFSSWRNLRLFKDIFRFNMLAKKCLNQEELKSMTLGQFLTKYRFSQDLAYWYLYPLLGAIWSCSARMVSDFPTYSTFRFLDNHRLLNVVRHPTWQTVRGGSITYVEKLRAHLVEAGTTILPDTPVDSIVRTADNQVAVTARGETHYYDYAIMATHADTALGIIGDIKPEEHAALSCFEYSQNKAYLHNDTVTMPKNKAAWSGWNYSIKEGDKEKNESIMVTYNMNILQGIEEKYPLFVTLNPSIPLKPESIYAEMDYAHPQYNLRSIEGQRRIESLQGSSRIFFAGAHLGFGFHEDGVVSAKKAVALLSEKASL